MNNVNGYTDYFRQLAISHKYIRHNPAGETGDAEPGSVHFTKVSVEEILNDLGSKIGWPLLALELYDIETEAETPLDIRVKPKGAFMVVTHPASNTFAAQMECYELTEKIVTDILKQIWQQHYAPGAYGCSSPFREVDFNKIEITPVGPVFGGEYGYRVVFDFEFQQTIDLTQPPEEGTFE